MLQIALKSRVGYLSKQLKCITKNLEKHGVRTMRKKHVFWVGLGLILGAILHHFGTQNALKTLMKDWKRFGRKKRGKNATTPPNPLRTVVVRGC